MTLLGTFIVLTLFYGSGYVFLYEPICSVEDSRFRPEYITIEEIKNDPECWKIPIKDAVTDRSQ